MLSATGQRPIANVSTARRDGAGIIKAVGCRERCDLGHGLDGRASSSGQLGDIRRDPSRLVPRDVRDGGMIRLAVIEGLNAPLFQPSVDH